MNAEQIRSAFEVVVGLPPREVDVRVVEALGATPEALADYIWDHWLGEPSQPTQEQMREQTRGLWRLRSEGEARES